MPSTHGRPLRDRPCPRDYEEKMCDALRENTVRLKAIQPPSNIDTFDLCVVSAANTVHRGSYGPIYGLSGL